MKALSLVVSTILISLSISSAQPLQSYGLKVGLINAEQDWSYLSNTNLESSNKSIWGFDVGIFAEWLSLPNLKLITELHFLQKGRTIMDEASKIYDNEQGYIDVGVIRVKHKFYYINVPILIKIETNESKVNPFISVGPNFEFLISHPTSDVYSKFNNAEIALKLTGGLEISLDFIPKLLFECRYNHGLTNAYKNEFVNIKNRAWEFIFGVIF